MPEIDTDYPKRELYVFNWFIVAPRNNAVELDIHYIRTGNKSPIYPPTLFHVSTAFFIFYFSLNVNKELYRDTALTTLPYKFYVLGQIGLSKQCRPRSDCF